MAEEYEKHLREEVGRIKRGGQPRHTFGDLMVRFVEEHFPNLRPEAARRYDTSIKALRPHFEALYLDQINKTKIAEFIAYRKRDGVTSTTIRRDLACASSAFTLGDEWGWTDANPFKAIKKRSIPEAEPRTRFLSREEYDRLVAHAGAYLRPLIEFAVGTGMRLEEQLSLRWEQVDFRRREIILPVTKAGTPRTVPLDAEMVAVLRARKKVQHITAPWVFFHGNGLRFGKLTRGLAGAAKRANVPDLRWHDLRRTYGSWKLQGGVDIFTVSRLLGHSTVAVTERSYAFLRTSDLHDAVQKWAQGTGIAAESVGANDS